MKNNRIRVIAASICVLFASFLCCQNTFADSPFAESSTMGQKALYSNVMKCYNSLKSSIRLSEFDGTYDSLSYYSSTVPWFGLAYNGPNYNGFSCKDVLTNKIANPMPTSQTTDNTEKAKRLADFYYTKSNDEENVSNNNEHCYQYYLNYDKYDEDNNYIGSGITYTQQLCVKKENGNSITYVKDVAGQTNGIVSFTQLGKNKLIVKVDVGEENFIGGKSDKREIDNVFSTDESTILSGVGKMFNEMVGSSKPGNVIRTESEEYGEMDRNGFRPTRDFTLYYYAACNSYGTYQDNGGVTCKNSNSDILTNYSVSFNAETTPDAEYLRNTRVTPDGLISKFSGGILDRYRIKFSDDEQYELYQYYLTNIFGVTSIKCASEQMYDNGVKTARLWWDEARKYSPYCNFRVTTNEDKKVWGVGDDGIFGVEMSLDEMIEKLNSLHNYAAPSTIVDDEHDPGTELDPSDGSLCYDSGGLNGMAWVICPTLYNLEGAAEGMSGWITSMLEIEQKYYGSDSESHRAWTYMRSIANVFLSIILVLVIFSQLTGYGIDNYGIKKILPKLVIMAILVNLSFLLCQIAIDISNVLGVGLNNLFQTVAQNKVTFKEVITGVFDGFMALLGVVGSSAGIIQIGIIAIGSGGEGVVVVVLLLALLTVLVGLFVFFLMLGARTIIIVLFSAISPIAFVCYILPNTQKWFKNWWKIFQTALVMYPICGAMYGLSMLIISIVFKSDMEPLHGVVAMITPVLPYYMLPTLLKNSMSALGTVGSIFNSIGNGLRKGISGASQTLRGSESFKAAEKESMRNRQLTFATRQYNRLKKRGGEYGQSLDERGQRRMAGAAGTMKALSTENAKARSALIENEFDQTDKYPDKEKAMNKAWAEAYCSGDEDRLNALTDVMTSSFGSGAISTMGKIMSMSASELESKYGIKNVDANMVEKSLKAIGNNTVTNKDFGKLFRAKATDAFRMATTREKDASGALYGMDHYSKNNSISTTYDDVLGQGAAAVQRTAIAGGFAAMLGSKDNPDDLSDPDNKVATKMLESEKDNQAMKAYLSDRDKRAAVEATAYAESQGKTIQAIMEENGSTGEYSRENIIKTLQKKYTAMKNASSSQSASVNQSSTQQSDAAAQPGQVFSPREQQQRETDAQHDYRTAQEKANTIANTPGTTQTKSGIINPYPDSVKTSGPREQTIYDNMKGGKKVI